MKLFENSSMHGMSEKIYAWQLIAIAWNLKFLLKKNRKFVESLNDAPGKLL
jgi:hypothetical protein